VLRRMASRKHMAFSDPHAVDAQAAELEAKRTAARMSITVIRDVPGGFLAGTGASIMAVYEEEKLKSDGNDKSPQSDGMSGSAAEADDSADALDLGGVLIVKVGGYVVSRIMPLCDGCGGRIRSLALAPGREKVACVSEIGPVALLMSLGGNAEGVAVDADGDGVDDAQFAAFSGGCHVASVTAVDVCFGSFPMAVTASADRTARLWHLGERRCMAVHRNNGYDISSVTLHPSGIIVAVSDECGIKLCDVCDEELAPADWSYDNALTDNNGLRVRAVLPTRKSGAMRFSHGGSYLAAAHRNQVNIYSVWTRTLVVCLTDAVKTVTALTWAPDDTRLTTGCSGGSMSVYRMEVDLGDIPDEGSQRRRAKQKSAQQAEYEETMGRIARQYQKDDTDTRGGESDDGASDAGSDGDSGAAAAGDLSRLMHLKSLGFTVKACQIASLAHVGPRPGSAQFATGDRGIGVVVSGGSDGVLRLIRGGQVEAESVERTSITAVETSLCGNHIFASLTVGTIVTRHIIATGREEEGGQGSHGPHGGGGSVRGSVDGSGGGAAARVGQNRGSGGSGAPSVRLHPHLRELRLTRHGDAVTCMRLSPDGASLICGAASGAVFIARVTTVINGLIHEPSALPPVAPSAKPLAMVPLDDIRDRNEAIRHLEEAVADGQKTIKFRFMMLETENEEKVKAAQHRIEEAEAERDRTQHDVLVAKQEMEVAVKESRRQMEATHMLAAEELEASYERRLVFETDRFQQLQNQVADYKLATEERMCAMQAAHVASQGETESASDEALRSAEERCAALEAHAAASAQAMEAVFRETEEQDLHDIDDVTTTLNQAKHDFHQFRNRMVGERKLLNQKVKVTKKLVDAERQSKNDQMMAVAQRDDVVNQLEIANDTLKREVRQRSDLMAAKDAELIQAKTKTHQLELVGQVMTYKHDELEKKSEPIVEEMRRLRAQIVINDAAMAGKVAEIQRARVQRGRDQDRILGMRRELAEMRDAIHAVETKFSRLLDDLRTAMTFTDNERDEALLRVNRVYVNQEEEAGEADVVVMEELLRQRVHLENERRSISKAAKLAAQTAAGQQQRLRAENAELLEDISELRRRQKGDDLHTKQLLERIERLKHNLRSNRRYDPGLGVAPGADNGGGSSLDGSRQLGDREPIHDGDGGIALDSGSHPASGAKARPGTERHIAMSSRPLSTSTRPASARPSSGGGGPLAAYTPGVAAVAGGGNPRPRSSGGGARERGYTRGHTVGRQVEGGVGGGGAVGGGAPRTQSISGGGGGGFSLDSGRQLSATRPISGGGGFSLDSGHQLSATRPISGGGGSVVKGASTRAMSEVISMDRGREDALLTQLNANERGRAAVKPYTLYICPKP